LHLPVAHVEAGLRSFDRTMPEEINRLLTDQMADLLFTPSEDANQNLLREGIPRERIHFVGNMMNDCLSNLRPRIAEADSEVIPLKYALVTLHRPSNVDDFEMLRKILNALGEISGDLPSSSPVTPAHGIKSPKSHSSHQKHCAFASHRVTFNSYVYKNAPR
jgi:UDP-N-acetylglucosamine 2-epimerase (non-hydrolysing)